MPLGKSPAAPVARSAEWRNQLHFGDNLSVLRSDIPSASVDLVYLDPPFNSKRDYNLLFKTPKGHESDAQIIAFEDSWHLVPGKILRRARTSSLDIPAQLVCLRPPRRKGRRRR